MKDEEIELNTAILAWKKGFPKKLGKITQSLLQKWLREKHNIHVECVHTTLDTLNNILYYCNIYNYENHHYLTQLNPIETKFYNNYEQALEEGLYKALELIKTK